MFVSKLYNITPRLDVRFGAARTRARRTEGVVDEHSSSFGGFAQNNQIRVVGKEADPHALTISTHALAPEGGVVFSRDGVVVTAFLVDHGHAKPAYGYRIDHADHAVVLSGDTTYAPNLVAHAKNVDLLIHCLAVASRQLEAAAPDYVNHFYQYLGNPEMVGRILGEVRPREAVFSHIRSTAAARSNGPLKMKSRRE